MIWIARVVAAAFSLERPAWAIPPMKACSTKSETAAKSESATINSTKVNPPSRRLPCSGTVLGVLITHPVPAASSARGRAYYGTGLWDYQDDMPNRVGALDRKVGRNRRFAGGLRESCGAKAR